MTTTTAADAIATSIREDRTVSLAYTEALHLDLLAETDADCDTSEGEYWGITEDGATWRVELVGGRAER